MNVSQKLTNARSNVCAYLPELMPIMNSVMFRETGVMQGYEDLPPMFLMGPTIHYVKSKVEDTPPEVVTYMAANMSYMVKYVFENQERMSKIDPQVNMVALNMCAYERLKDLPPHAFRAPDDVVRAPDGVIEGKSVEEVYNMLMDDPTVFGEKVVEYMKDIFEEQKAKPHDSKTDQEKLNPWVDKQ